MRRPTTNIHWEEYRDCHFSGYTNVPFAKVAQIHCLFVSKGNPFANGWSRNYVGIFLDWWLGHPQKTTIRCRKSSPSKRSTWHVGRRQNWWNHRLPQTKPRKAVQLPDKNLKRKKSQAWHPRFAANPQAPRLAPRFAAKRAEQPRTSSRWQPMKGSATTARSNTSCAKCWAVCPCCTAWSSSAPGVELSQPSGKDGAGVVVL